MGWSVLLVRCNKVHSQAKYIIGEMTLNIPLNTPCVKSLLLLSVLGILTACSSKPSPWAEKSSPWAEEQNQQETTDDVVDAMDGPVGMAGMDDAPMVESGMTAPPSTGDLGSLPTNYFTVQLCASSSMENLRFFARQHGLSDQWTARTNVNGRTWYVLLLGVYPTRGEAASALAGVRSRLDTTPWIRSLGSLQSVLIQ